MSSSLFCLQLRLYRPFILSILCRNFQELLSHRMDCFLCLKMVSAMATSTCGDREDGWHIAFGCCGRVIQAAIYDRFHELCVTGTMLSYRVHESVTTLALDVVQCEARVPHFCSYRMCRHKLVALVRWILHSFICILVAI